MPKIKGTKQKWLEKGYEHFALYGPENLSINKISREIGSPRASFYHYFGDMDVFTEELLTMHWEIGQQFTLAGPEKCKKLFPDLYKLLEQYPIPLQFSRQLFLNRHIPAFNYLFLKMYRAHARAFILDLFSKHFKFHQDKNTIYELWLTMGEAWYSRLDPDDLSALSMETLAKDILSSVLTFITSDLYSRIHLK